MLDLDISVAWAVGLSLAVSRAAAFVGFCSFVSRTIPVAGRNALGLALGLLIAVPVPVAVDAGASDLIVSSVVNITLGAVMGWFLGLPLFLFQAAGTVLDTASGLSIGAVFDPDSGTSPGPMARAYTFTGQALVVAVGGLMVMAQLLWYSTKAVALDGSIGSMSGLGSLATDGVDLLMRRGVELAMPILSVLFVGELAFGLLSRMAPQINTFLVGLPLKTVLTLSMLGSGAVIFPHYVDELIATGTDSVLKLLGA